jgi:molybdate transport system regulatory protein
LQILRAIGETGSIAAAARTMGMSYRRAWLLVDDINHCFASPLVESVSGGKRGGGARLTEQGQEVIALYADLLAQTEAAIFTNPSPGAARAKGKRLDRSTAAAKKRGLGGCPP